MKTAVFAFCFLGATAALGQSFSGAQMTSVLQFNNHAERASQQSMAREQNLLESSNYFFAQGERPLWEVQPLSQTRPVPLGDIARMLRKEHEASKKADVVVHD
jgi:hypothetical protein